MERIQHDLRQGTDEWDAFRVNYDGASEAGAAMGLNPKVKRNELLHMKATGSAKEFSDWVQKNILDYGHEVEALARPLVESIIGEKLYPVVYSYGRKSASCDGLTFDGVTAFEHKQWNAELAESVARKELPEMHQPQCQQVMDVTGAERLIFVVSDGTPDRFVWMEVLPDPQWVKRIDDAWTQFNKDRETYVPVEIVTPPVAAPIAMLPSVYVQVSGQLTINDNLKPFGEKLRELIAGINKKPENDQDFADAIATIKVLEEAEAALLTAKAAGLAQIGSVDDMCNMIDLNYKMARENRLALQKIVEAEKENRRVKILQGAKDAFTEHISSLNAALGKPYMPEVPVDFVKVMKNLRTISSLQNAVDTELARGKIAANEVFQRIQINLKYLRDNAREYGFLFNDTSSIVQREPDYVAMLATTRINEHKAAEAKKEDEFREKVRREEEEKAQQKLREEQAKTEQHNNMLLSEIQGIQQQVMIATLGRAGVRKGGTIECIRETLAETEKWVIDTEHFGALAGSAQVAKDAAINQIRQLLETAEKQAAEKAQQAQDLDVKAVAERDKLSTVVTTQKPTEVYAAVQATSTVEAITTPIVNPNPQPVVPISTQPDLRLGMIAARLGFNVTADFLTKLGFPPVAKMQSACLYHEETFPLICDALVGHISNVKKQT